MDRATSIRSIGFGWDNAPSRAEKKGPMAADHLLRIVDAGLLGVIFVAPFFFGGRHDLGRLVLVSLVAMTAAAWFARQAMLPTARWPQTIAHAILLLATALLVVQIVPLPPEWLACLVPGRADVLPLWMPGSGDLANLGTWQTLSLTPHETTKSLAMLLSYSLLFVVVAGRIQQTADVERLLSWIAASAVFMAMFGVVHYFTSDGHYFWFYAHPHRNAGSDIGGAFVNRNHFANFLVLGVGPLAAWLLRAAPEHLLASCTEKRYAARNHKSAATAMQQITTWTIAAVLAFVVFAALASRSRGGAIALVAAATVLVTIYWCRGLVDSRFIYGLVGLVVVVVGLLSLHGYDGVAKRLGDFTEGSLDDIDHTGIRRTLWAANLAAFEAHGLFGAGAGSHREVLPVYLQESFTKEYTHAENGYLQVATETGSAGVILLAGGLALVGGWCATCFRHATAAADVRAFGAVAAGLTASLVHSCVDFVWYIPACLSITIVLAGCLLRLSQLSREQEAGSGKHGKHFLLLASRSPLLLAAAATLVGAWTVHVYVGPAVATVYWDRYLRASVASSKLSREQVSALVSNRSASNPNGHAALNDLMLRQLEQVVKWDPHFARARLRLAAQYIARFELSQQHAENAMGVAQIRDAVLASSFASQAELHAWLQRAIGDNVEWLWRAAAEARLAVTLCPLQGEGYVYLADLCFLHGEEAAVAESYVDQALRVRPHNAEVHFEVGKQKLMAGNLAVALAHWQQCFRDPGPHQQKIIYLLAGRIPAPMFVATFHPDWRTLRTVWARYRGSADPRDLESLLAYAAERTALETQDGRGVRKAFIWFWQSGFYAELGRGDETLACLERAYAHNPRQYAIRHALATALQNAGRFAEAEPHVRWCLARRPADKTLTSALLTITKHRHAQRERVAMELPSNPTTQR